MKNVLLFFSLFLTLVCGAQTEKPAIAIIPEPVSVQAKTGAFVLPKSITIQAPSGDALGATVSYLRERLSVPTGYKVTVAANAPAAAINLQLNKSADPGIGSEGYRLSVTPKGITIKANAPAGLFYGVQTLLQLFPKEIESSAVASNVKWTAPAVEITDYPRFGWRGLMFDVSRHFFTKQEVKDFIDNMVRYKYNLLHWHLTDDEGWRIQIEGLPNLTKVGAWNVKKEGYFGTFSPPGPDEPRNYGGFYTQADIREVVQYAKERFVDVLPEIDVPGHSLAAIVAYPELSCTEGADKYVVRSGEPIMDWSRGAPPIAMVDNTLCPANEKVYAFMDKVITQVAQLFPFEYIHLGGDEAPHNFWEKNEQVKALMQREGLKTIPQVQEYFTRRMEKIVASKGKKLIGWDEILEGGDLPKSTAVMSWRGMKYGIEAAKKGHEVVMSPTTYAYLDYMQGDPIVEPRIYASLRLRKAYEFDPLPEGVDKKFIKGGQGNLWTEQVYNMRHGEYMRWPRGWALAESLWSPKEKKNWKDFFGRVEDHFERFDVADIKYAPSVYDPSFKATRGADSTLKIELATEANDLTIHYSFDNTFPDHHSPKYTGALTAPKDAVQLKVVTYRGKEQKGRMLAMPIEELKKRADSKRNYE
ncbi:MAG: family 20 glycosylhydrolase [Bacteroidota bacterium]|nr:family 20 glycosylhydrolase [Bacteroidota bacterium]